MRSWQLVAVAFWMFALSGCASQGMSFWRAEQLSQYQTSSVRLHHQGQTIGYINPAQVRILIDVKNQIERVTTVSSADLVIVNLKEPNAFATRRNGLPVVGVSLGMLELLGWDRDAYAAILGHEYAHLVLDHRSARAEREATAEGARQALGLVLSFAGVPMGRTIANLGVTAIERVYTRDEEREADRLGFEYAMKANFDADGGVRLWEKMRSAAGVSIPFLSTHPMSAERVETMKSLARANREVSALPPSQPRVDQPNGGCDSCPSRLQYEPGDRSTSETPIEPETAIQVNTLAHALPAGAQYVGSLVDGRPHGHGTLTCPDGAEYTGTFSNGKYSGQGVYYWPDDGVSRQCGDGNTPWRGTYYIPGGSKYFGAFRDGLFHGQGAVYGRNGSVMQSGLYEKGMFVGAELTPKSESPSNSVKSQESPATGASVSGTPNETKAPKILESVSCLLPDGTRVVTTRISCVRQNGTLR